VDPLALIASIILGLLVLLLVVILAISFIAAGKLAKPPRKSLSGLQKTLD